MNCTSRACGQTHSRTRHIQKIKVKMTTTETNSLYSKQLIKHGRGILSSQTLSLAHWMVCSITEGKDLRVQNGISSSGGSLWKANEKMYVEALHLE